MVKTDASGAVPPPSTAAETLALTDAELRLLRAIAIDSVVQGNAVMQHVGLSIEEMLNAARRLVTARCVVIIAGEINDASSLHHLLLGINHAKLADIEPMIGIKVC